MLKVNFKNNFCLILLFSRKQSRHKRKPSTTKTLTMSTMRSWMKMIRTIPTRSKSRPKQKTLKLSNRKSRPRSPIRFPPCRQPASRKRFLLTMRQPRPPLPPRPVADCLRVFPPVFPDFHRVREIPGFPGFILRCGRHLCPEVRISQERLRPPPPPNMRRGWVGLQPEGRPIFPCPQIFWQLD